MTDCWRLRKVEASTVANNPSRREEDLHVEPRHDVLDVTCNESEMRYLTDTSLFDVGVKRKDCDAGYFGTENRHEILPRRQE